MPVVLVSSDRFASHQTPPGHPECSDRARVMDSVAVRWRAQGGAVVAPRLATLDQLLRVHDQTYVDRITATAGRAVALDPDTYTSPDSYGVALLAAGAAVDAVDSVLDGAHARALALVRPPGHHAERGEARGFCLFNNVAVAAAHARARGAARVAIVDVDVHHGNGTQHIFESDPEVLYLSLHQSPFYPGTGQASEIGIGRGRGFTVNLPLEAGAGADDYRVLFEEVVDPVVTQFAPSLILVSLGVDAHERDPLAGMRLGSSAFGAMIAHIRHVADACCAGRVVAVTEGGYDLVALAESLTAALEVLAEEPVGAPSWVSGADRPVSRTARGRAPVGAVRPLLSPFWRL